jgi:hypothetical protein
MSTSPQPPEPPQPPRSLGWPYRGSRPDWAPSASPRGWSQAEIAALERMFAWRDGRPRQPQPQPRPMEETR